jgi:hypothetical protein
MNNQETLELTPKKFLKTISIIHLAILAGTAVFALITFTKFEETKFSIPQSDDIDLYLVPGLAIVAVFFGDFYSRKLIAASLNLATLKEKLTRYQSASIINYALVEGAAFFGIFNFGAEGNLFYLCISGVLLVYLFLLRPTKENIENKLNLTREQASQFNSPEEVLV